MDIIKRLKALAFQAEEIEKEMEVCDYTDMQIMVYNIKKDLLDITQELRDFTKE